MLWFHMITSKVQVPSKLLIACDSTQQYRKTLNETNHFTFVNFQQQKNKQQQKAPYNPTMKLLVGTLFV